MGARCFLASDWRRSRRRAQTERMMQNENQTAAVGDHDQSAKGSRRGVRRPTAAAAERRMIMAEFLIGAMIGAIIGIGIMCVFAISREKK